MTTTLTYGSLFTGVGGFDMGFDQHGYTCKWQVEWDQHCQQTLAHHWPDVPRHGDVQTVNGHHLQPTDVIIYGSPCQDLSVAGQRRGLDGQKSSMFHEAVRIFKEMRNATNNTYPRITIWENVPGALTSNRGHDFQTVLTELENIGALSQWWYVLDAQHFGIPQRRRRVFLISVFDPAIAERAGHAEILPIATRSTRHSQKSTETQQATATTIADSIGTPRPIGFGYNAGLNHQASEEVFPTLRVSQGGRNAVLTDQEPLFFHPHFHDGARIQTDTLNTITARWGTGGNNGDMVVLPVATLTAHLGKGIDAESATGGQLLPTNGTVRRLTPVECERLMGWPDNHTLNRADGKTNSNSTRYKMCGNGVATPVAAWIAQHIKPLLTER